MRVSQRLEYALRALVALAALPVGTTVVAGELAGQVGLPRRFLEQQFTALADRGLVSCRRGAGGGCGLARGAGDITVGDVMRAIEGDVLDVPRVSGSAASEIWAEVAARLAETVDGITLAELVRRQGEMDADRTPMYFI